MRLKNSLLVGAATTALLAGLGFASVSQAKPVPEAETYADLLEPVPNAAERLAADDVQRDSARPVEMAQVYLGVGPVAHHHHHHHHHHGSWYRSHGYYWNGGAWMMHPRHHHHHHHHHHNY